MPTRGAGAGLDLPEPLAPNLPSASTVASSTALERLGIATATGRFGEEMLVELVNDGPFTIWLDSDVR